MSWKFLLVRRVSGLTCLPQKRNTDSEIVKYRASKAAVNSIAKSVDIYLKQTCGDNAMCVSLHPGTVKTGLSQNFWGSMPKEKLFTPEFAAERLIQVANEIGLHGRGKCWDWDGKEISP